MPSSRFRAVFLDRDGVLNRAKVSNGKPYPPRTLEELEILPEARLGCQLLKDAGFRLICVTNQPDVARGDATREEVDALNGAVVQELALDDLRVCLHDDADACDCRKPAPGLLTSAAADWGVDLASSFMVGDRWRDIEAGRTAGCRTVFIDRGYLERHPDHTDATAASLLEAAHWIIASPNNGAPK